MKVPSEVICNVCKKIFCCSECRHKHEIKTHALAAIVNGSGISKTTNYLFCPICEEKPLVLKSVMSTEILEHIEQIHLPLQCQKCFKLYAKIEDLREFSKCFQLQDTCHSPKYGCQNEVKTVSRTNSKENIVKKTTATQTSPIILQGNSDSHYVTPNSMINLRWKSKSKIVHEGFVSDSVSSIKNNSSITSNNSSSIKKSISVCKGKLVRSTSTPLAAELFISKPNDQGFNASTSGQVSSIYNSGYDSSGSNPLSKNQAGTPGKQTLDMNRYHKVGGRAKMSAVTPLRQIMSKSIQKAFAEHGFSKPLRGADGGNFGKKIFENTDSLVEHPISNTINAITSPLDLRLSPALRRSNSEPTTKSNTDMTDFYDLSQAQMKRNVLLSSKKTTTESIVITSSIQHLTSLELARDNGSANSISMAQPNTISITSNCAEAHSVRRPNSSASLYQTCSSVKIIHTSTELSAHSLQDNSSYPEEQSKEKQPLLSACLYVPTENFDLFSNDYADHTPTTRVKGSVIKEKLIRFDTPKVEECLVKVNQKENSSDDVFFTPDATPLRKPRLRMVSPKDRKESDERKRKQIRGRRSYLKDCKQISSFNRIQDITDDEDIDEVFLSETDVHKKPDETHEKLTVASGRSLWSLVSSAIMRIPSFKGQPTKILEKSQSMGLEACSKFILKRCASIAGSIVRSKSLDAEEQLNSLKRKRTYTMDSQNTTYSSTYGCESVAVSNKRLRIQARKPIDRMRSNN